MIQRSILFLILFLAACTTPNTSKQAPSYLKEMPDYVQTIAAHTQFYRQYDGFYEVFRGHATLMSPECQTAIVKQRATLLKWDEKKFQDEKIKAQQEMAAQTTIFLQFYTPEPDYNDLNKFNSIWHVFLNVDGREFEGKIRKARGKLIEFEAIYPEYDKFSTPYEITFDISTADVIRHQAKLTLASTLGEAVFVFPPSN